MHMADIDTIAYLHPAVGTEGATGASWVIYSKENAGRFVGPLRNRPPSSPQTPSPESNDRSERAGIEEPEEPEEHYDSVDNTACLRVSLADVPKGQRGLEVGCDPKADIVLPKLRGVSFRHFSLTFNDDYYFVVRDLGSTIGTSVTYGTGNAGPRTNFEWVIGGDEFLQAISPIIIRIPSHIHFQIVVKPFDRGSAAFRAKVDKFRAGQGTGGINMILDGAIIQSDPGSVSTFSDHFLSPLVTTTVSGAVTPPRQSPSGQPEAGQAQQPAAPVEANNDGGGAGFTTGALPA